MTTTNKLTQAALKVKPLSVNECWQGRRFKTDKYKAYELDVYYKLPAMKLPPPPYLIIYEFGFSNMAADFDNPVKPLTDILQKKYGFNDSQIHQAFIKKVKVAKGEEYIKFEVRTTDDLLLIK